MHQMTIVKICGAIGVGLGAYSLPLMASDHDFIVTRQATRYIEWLDAPLKLSAAKVTGKEVFWTQLGAIVGSILIGCADLFDYWFLLVGAAIVAPPLLVGRTKAERIEKLESQMDGFLLAYANGLKAVPNVGAALLAIEPVLSDPLRTEIQIVLREMRVGSSIEVALKAFSRRIGSRLVDDALTSVLIGLQVGGDLPTILATTAASLREMARLDGFLRSKTAEGKAQLWVIGAIPFVILYAMNKVSPGYFIPLQGNLPGYVVTAIAVCSWIGALALARKILNVDF